MAGDGSFAGHSTESSATIDGSTTSRRTMPVLAFAACSANDVGAKPTSRLLESLASMAFTGGSSNAQISGEKPASWHAATMLS